PPVDYDHDTVIFIDDRLHSILGHRACGAPVGPVGVVDVVVIELVVVDVVAFDVKARVGVGHGVGLLNWSQAPEIFSSFSTCSVGRAPLRSQPTALSLSMFTRDGSALGSYVPRISMNRPSRGERPSAATTRYVGCLVFPIRIK